MFHPFDSQESSFVSSQTNTASSKGKEFYKAPKLKVHGKLERLTLQNGAGSGPLGDGGDPGTGGVPGVTPIP